MKSVLRLAHLYPWDGLSRPLPLYYNQTRCFFFLHNIRICTVVTIMIITAEGRLVSTMSTTHTHCQCSTRIWPRLCKIIGMHLSSIGLLQIHIQFYIVLLYTTHNLLPVWKDQIFLSKLCVAVCEYSQFAKDHVTDP